MKATVSKRFMLNFVAADQGGALTYVINVCCQLASLNTRARFVVLLCPEAWAEAGGLPTASHIDYRTFDWPKKCFLHRLWFDQVTVKHLARRNGARCVYSQVFAVRGFPGRQVLNLHNPVYFSDLYSDRYVADHALLDRAKLWLRRRWTYWSIKQADVVIAPTQAMLDKAAAVCGKQNGQVWRAVHHGFDRAEFLNGRSLNEKHQRVLDRVASGVPKILFVSGFCEHKNVDTLFEAFTEYRMRGNDGVLILTFAREALDKAGGARARRAFGSSPFQKDVVFLGRVPWEEIWNVYAQSDVFAFPSYLESFGFPMVEAMASGLPVVASDTAVNREILQDAAVYFDTFDAEDLADKLEAVTRDKQMQDQLTEKGRRRSNDFSWEKHVRQIVALLLDETAPEAASLASWSSAH